MIHPPVIRGGAPVRWAALLLGLGLFAFGIVLQFESRLGLPPWDVLNQGISDRTPLSFGAANVGIALFVLVLAARLGAWIGPGTVANAVLIGFMVDLLLRSETIASLGTGSLAQRVLLMVGGIAVIGVGSALYIGAALGAGPRDSLMLVLARLTGVRIGAVRAVLELTVTLVGLALGGTVGIGTVAFALGIGPAVEGCFRLSVRLRIADPAAP